MHPKSLDQVPRETIVNTTQQCPTCSATVLLTALSKSHPMPPHAIPAIRMPKEHNSNQKIQDASGLSSMTKPPNLASRLTTETPSSTPACSSSDTDLEREGRKTQENNQSGTSSAIDNKTQKIAARATFPSLKSTHTTRRCSPQRSKTQENRRAIGKERLDNQKTTVCVIC
jgi:hypothetical protein